MSDKYYELIEYLKGLETDVEKFYGKGQAARRVLSYCWKNHLLTIRTLTNYVASIDPSLSIERMFSSSSAGFILKL